MLPVDLSAEWRALAETFYEHKDDGIAIAYERCASGLDEALAAEGDEPLTLHEAADESGYSPDHLGRLVRDGKVPNAGRPGSPRIARRDVPVRPKARVPTVAETPSRSETSNRQIVQSIINEGVG